MPDSADELAAIRRMMDEAQHATEDDGKYFVSWGVLTVVGLGATYLTLARGTSPRLLWITWAALVAVGWILALRWGRRDHARAPVRTVAGTMLGESWAATGICMTLLVFAGAASGTISPQAVPGIVCALIGSGTFASASLYRQLPLRTMALGWWAGALVMLLRPGAYTILLTAVLVVALFVAPGFVLRARARADRSPDDTA